MKTKFLIALLSVLVAGTLTFVSAQEFSPSGRDYVPYTENYNVSFNHDGNVDYDLLIAKIMLEIFEKMFREQGVDIAQQDIVLNRGPQIAMYQESSYNCGYVIDYSDNQVYWLEAAINSQEIEYTRIFTETPIQPQCGRAYTDYRPQRTADQSRRGGFHAVQRQKFSVCDAPTA